ncbi:MAG TPA: SRPBCC family protein [Rhizomicrobium sp.]|nr:SRPBCC family protein [Rhizomicrobium sp.]
MKTFLTGAALLGLMAMPVMAADYTSYTLSIVANAAPEKTWARIGGFCAIHDWLGTSCEIASGNGEVGTIRKLNDGKVTEMMVAKTPFSYTYIQPLNPSNLYHGTLAVEPDGAGRSKINYTFLYDQEPLGDDAAKVAAKKQRDDRFNAALAKMKAMAEAP